MAAGTLKYATRWQSNHSHHGRGVVGGRGQNDVTREHVNHECDELFSPDGIEGPHYVEADGVQWVC